MSTPMIIKYPLDLTGKAGTNLITQEPHNIPAGKQRGFALNYGAFYTKSLVLRDSANNILKPNVDYIALHLYELATKYSGEEVCAAVLLINDTIVGDVTADYQCVGGEYVFCVGVINQLIADLQLDNRTIAWGDIIGVLDEFPPAPHMHSVDELYGFEYLIDAMNKLIASIRYGDTFDHKQLYAKMAALKNTLSTGLSDLQQALGLHVNDTNNPHQVTKAQVGLGNVDNYATASDSDMEAGVATNRFTTPAGVFRAIAKKVGDAFTQHVNNTSNPHATTKAQVGLGSVDNFATASQAEAEAGTSNSLFVTPLRLAQAIASRVGNSLTNHINNTSNPHATTKAQVGLGNVDNFATATQVDAVDGTRDDVFMTPFKVAQAIAMKVGYSLTNHINSKSNPHTVTKVQVGLGNVANYGVSDIWSAMEGTSNTLYMTPYLTQQLVANRLGAYVPTSGVNYGSSSWYDIVNKVAWIKGDGGLEIGQYLDFHAPGDTGDYTARFIVQGGSKGTELYATCYMNYIDGFNRSDERDKTDIEALPLDRANDILLSLESGITYYLLQETERTAGLSAQKTLKVFPEAVNESVVDESGTTRYSLRSSALIGCLVSGYNYQAKQLAKLEAENAELKKQAAEFKDELAQLSESVENFKKYFC